MLAAIAYRTEGPHQQVNDKVIWIHETRDNIADGPKF